MGKEESQLEKLQEELLLLIPAESKGKALSIIKELDVISKRMIGRDIRKGYKSAITYIIEKHNL